MEKLLLLIGKGQKELAREGLKIERMTYRETEYFLSDNTEESFKTPFVGEAIVRLYPQRFEQVHIFGTKDAMWDILYYHCRAEVNKDLPDEYIEPFLQLCEAIEQHNWQEPDCLLDYVAQSFSAKTGIRCFCHLIDLGITPEELWKTFQLMTSPHLKLDGHKISIDITHSLRFHPLFFVFTLNYLQSVSPKTRFGSIFYGAFELSANFNKKTPIFDLKTFIDIMKWIDAAQAFRQYGDASAIAKLLEENGTLQPLIDDLKKFSQIIQLNAVDNVQKNAQTLLERLESVKETAPIPLKLIAPRLIEFPQQLRNTKTSWNAIIKVSKYHYENGHLGLSVLAAWEAVMDRLAGIYQVDSRNIENYKRLGKVVRSHDFDRIYGQTLGFPSKMRSLSKFRNGIAHAEECQFSDIANEFPIILKLLERRLGDTSLDSLPNYVAWETI